MKSISLYNFGGSEDVIKQIQTPFVNLFKGFGPVLDIGCGRGIFLQLLSEACIEAVGVDHSEEAIRACQEKGLIVHRQGGREYLSQNPGRFGGIFCSHVIEHMEYGDAMSFLQLCHRALRIDGIILLVTPNPRDLTIMTEVFWLDPTHVRPYPGPLLGAMLESTGFELGIERQFLGSVRLVGRRNLPLFLVRKMLLGPYYGKPNTMVLARKRESQA